MAISRQWKRKAQVIIGKDGRGLSIKDLRVAFEVQKTAEPAPNIAVIRIWNLSPSNEQLIKTEYDDVLLNVGYEDAMRLVFRGNIKHVYRYRDGNDFITEIEAADGDKDFRTAIINETLAAGTSNDEVVKRAVKSFKGGTTQGYTKVKKRTRLRGKVISGATRDVLNDIARESGANWSIQDGQLVIVPASGYLPNEAAVIRSDTGMLGSPEVNENGVTVRCLLNPQLLVNGAIKLDNNGIKAQAQKLGKTAKGNEDVVTQRRQLNEPVRLSPDGIYKILKLTHKGDTRGGDWISEIESVAL